MKMRNLSKLALIIVLLSLLVVEVLSNILNNVEEQDNVHRFAIIVKSDENMYNQELIKGFCSVIEQNGDVAVVRIPTTTDVVEQIKIVNELMDQKVDCIAISGNDRNALEPVLSNAMESGIKVLSFDSSINKESRMLHINQADPESIARLLLEQASSMANGTGQVAILSTTTRAHNQQAWIQWMRHLLEKGEYKDLTLVDITYGDDNYSKSVKKTNQLIQNYKDLDVIIAPTAVGIVAAAESITAKGLEEDIKVTGLGLPSEMAEYIGDDKVCPAMFLWNPIEVGKLTAYASIALVEDQFKGNVGEVLQTDEMGNYTVIYDEYGGTEIILQPKTMRFDKTNINEWKDKY